jgi:hypothetical protein
MDFDQRHRRLSAAADSLNAKLQELLRLRELVRQAELSAQKCSTRPPERNI